MTEQPVLIFHLNPNLFYLLQLKINLFYLKKINLFHLFVQSDDVSDVVKESSENHVIGMAGFLGVFGGLLSVLKLRHFFAWTKFIC